MGVDGLEFEETVFFLCSEKTSVNFIFILETLMSKTQQKKVSDQLSLIKKKNQHNNP